MDTAHALEEEKEQYYKVNTELTASMAKKQDGVGQFIFMSSMIVYGDSDKVGEEKE